MKFSLLTLLSLLSCIIPLSSASIWDEAFNGDISSNYLAPSAATLSIGSNTLNHTVSPIDQDHIVLTVPAGLQLDAVVVDNYNTSAGGTGVSLMGYQVGIQLSMPPSNAFSDPFYYVLHGAWAIGLDVLPFMSVGPGAPTPPLQAGNYVFWLQETAATASTSLDFQVSEAVPEPSAGLLCTLLASLYLIRRRKP